MKIGILTLPLHKNYGGILQNWALQQILIDLGHQPLTINRRKDDWRPSVRNYSLKLLSLIKTLILKLIFKGRNREINNPFSQNYSTFDNNKSIRTFISRNIVISRPIYSSSSLKEFINNSKFDAIIVGSDQVWREEYFEKIEDFYLKDITSTKKIALSASFGSESPFNKINKNTVKDLLSDFNAISMRERSGIEILKSNFNLDSELIADPTLLINPEKYFELSESDNIINNHYIATYILDKTEEKSKIIDSLKESIDIGYLKELSMSPPEGIEMDSIEEWISIIRNAEYIITDSFHGCLFSIIFKKPFLVFANAERGIDRFRTILDELNLSDRMIYDENDFNNRINQLKSIPDYTGIENKLNLLRQKGINFLTSAINQ